MRNNPLEELRGEGCSLIDQHTVSERDGRLQVQMTIATQIRRTALNNVGTPMSFVNYGLFALLKMFQLRLILNAANFVFQAAVQIAPPVDLRTVLC
jgi:hypothetical protein